MVLQNKFKARASRRYNAARGGASDGRGRGRGGRGGGSRIDPTSFPSLPGQEDGDGQSEDDEDEEAAAARQEQAKSAPRKLVSNAWRFDEPKDEDAAGEGDVEEEPEPEVDLSGLLERVAKLDSSRTSKALSSDRAAQLAVDAEAADIDASLLHLLDRQRERERVAAAASSDQADSTTTIHAIPRHVLTDEQRAELELEGRRLQEEKVQREKHERRARALQQGGGAKTISLDIGSSRRLDNESDEKRKAQRRDAESAAKARLAPHFLFDDDEEEGAKEHRPNGDVDDFLNDIQTTSQNSTDTGEYAITTSRRTERSPARLVLPTASANAPDKDEDFLDSIL